MKGWRTWGYLRLWNGSLFVEKEALNKTPEGADALTGGNSSIEEFVPRSSYIISIRTQNLCVYKTSITKRGCILISSHNSLYNPTLLD